MKLADLDVQPAVAQKELRDTLHNLSAPTSESNIPDEIITMIFEEGMRLEWHTEVPSREVRLEIMAHPEVHFGQLVSHVSHRWRSIALTTPNLWTEIRYVESSYDDASTSIEMITTYLSRSRSAPLDIYVQADTMPLPPVLNQSISDHIGHCRRLELYFPYDLSEEDGLRPLFECAFQQAAPLLRSFKWSCSTFHLPGPMFSCGAPNVKILDLDGIPHDCVLALCLPAFTSVTHFRLPCRLYFTEMATSYYRSFDEILMSLPALVHLELTMDSMVPLERIWHIVLPTLQFLHVDGSSLNGITKNFRSDSLTSLSMSGWFYELQGAVPDPSNPVAFPFPSLRHLILQDGIPYALRRFTSLAKILPNIERLTCGVGLEHPAPSAFFEDAAPDPQENVEAILNALINAADDGAPWSTLNTIAVSTLTKPLDASVLCTLVRRLRDARCPLRTLLIPTTSVSRQDMAELRKFIHVEDFQDGLPMLIEEMF